MYDPEDPTGYWNPQMADGHPTATLDNDYQLSTGENFSFRTTLYMDVNLKWIKGLSVRADASYGYGLAQSDYWLSGLITNTGNVDGNQGNKARKRLSPNNIMLLPNITVNGQIMVWIL